MGMATSVDLDVDGLEGVGIWTFASGRGCLCKVLRRNG